MTPGEFIAKWRASELKERSAPEGSMPCDMSSQPRLVVAERTAGTLDAHLTILKSQSVPSGMTRRERTRLCPGQTESPPLTIYANSIYVSQTRNSIRHTRSLRRP